MQCTATKYIQANETNIALAILPLRQFTDKIKITVRVDLHCRPQGYIDYLDILR
jgi:hypothetical protein